MASGLTLDVYDDQGTLLRSIWPTVDDLPDMVKQAAILPQASLDRMPDQAFALVVHTPEYSLRKYACVDLGNTRLSVEYFLRQHEALPELMRKTAAANLAVACLAYDMAPPQELVEIARNGELSQTKQAGLLGSAMGGLGKVMTGMQVLGTGKEAVEKGRMAAQLAPLASPKQVSQALAQTKVADLTGTSCMPIQPTTSGKTAPVSTTPVRKTAASVSVLENNQGDRTMNQAPRNPPQAKPMKPDAQAASDTQVATGPTPAGDVTKHAGDAKAWSQLSEGDREGFENLMSTPGISARGNFRPITQDHLRDAAFRGPVVKLSSDHRLLDRYPVDTLAQVKVACSYFERYGRTMPADDRREYCSELVKRAALFHHDVPEAVMAYGTEEPSCAEMRKSACLTRRNVVQNDSAAVGAIDQIEKVAHITSPEQFATLLRTFDKNAGIAHHYDSHLVDPYLSAYTPAQTKTAEQTFDLGTVRVSATLLTMLGTNHRSAVCERFGQDMANEFMKDPVAIFKSMPDPSKRVLANMANDLEHTAHA